MSTTARRLPRLLAVGTRTHVAYLSRSPLDMAFAILLPVVYATLAAYLFRAGGHPDRLLEAAVGAGLMGIWTSVLFGSGTAVQNQRWLGTLETLVAAPTPLVLVLLPVTVATAVIGTYAMAATVLWGVLLFSVPLDFAHPLLFLAAVPGCVLAMGMMGLLLASTFVLLRHANALTNALEAPVWLLSGVLTPTGALPHWTAPLSAVLPTTWGARALRAAASGGDVLGPLAAAVGLGALYTAVAVAVLGRVERRARQSATLALS
ncbi:ABC transporter permease [Streptomyces sp. NPDC050560]|uniref:ABC transporter permease n=1 Tax=Streptomyces sp. NPDC050560 TaxID=3365630 RepID=UPI0037A1EBCE